MGIFSQIPWLSKRSLENPKNPITGASIRDGEFAFQLSKEAKMVNYDNAMRVSSLFAAQKVITECFASLQVGVFKKVDSRGNVEEIHGHPLKRLFSSETSGLYNAFSWKETSKRNCILRGNSFNRIYFDKDSQQPIEFEILDNKDVKIKKGKSNRKLYYEVEGLGRRLQAYEVLHVPAFSKDGYSGIGLIEYAAETLALAIKARQYATAYFAKGGTLSGFVVHPDKLSPQGKANLKASINLGADGGGGIGVLEEDMKYLRAGSTLQEADLNAINNALHADIARFLGVPLHMIQDLDRATNNNIEQQSIDWVMYFFRPWIKRWETEINIKCFTDDEKKQNYFFRFNLDSLLRGDTKARSEYYKTMISIRAMNPNEVRLLERMNTYEGGDIYENPFTSNNDQNSNSKEDQKQ